MAGIILTPIIINAIRTLAFANDLREQKEEEDRLRAWHRSAREEASRMINDPELAKQQFEKEMKENRQR